MKLNKNLQNLSFVILVTIFLGLGCSETDREPKPTPPPRRGEYQMAEDNNQPSNSTTTTNVNNYNSESNKMSNVTENKSPVGSEKTNPVAVDRTNFYSVLEASLSKHNLNKSSICDENNAVQKRVLLEYGALFLTTAATPPPTCMFKNEDEVRNFQTKAGIASQNIGGVNIELQPTAMKALLAAIAEAKSKGLSITPRDGTDAGRRSFGASLENWKSRFDPACEHWKKKGKLTAEQVNRLKSLPMIEQVKEVLELEKQGLYFNTFFNATILSSVAAPGTSPHISMYAFDVTEFQKPEVKQILANHGWFRTIKGDEPHFTFLGVKEDELKNMGLQKIDTPKGVFWVPNV